jgi:hypothetical protein
LSPSPLDPPIVVIAQLPPNLLPTSLAPDHSDEPKTFVALRQGRHFLTTFHPELTMINLILSLVMVLLVPTCKFNVNIYAIRKRQSDLFGMLSAHIPRPISRIHPDSSPGYFPDILSQASFKLSNSKISRHHLDIRTHMNLSSR